MAPLGSPRQPALQAPIAAPNIASYLLGAAAAPWRAAAPTRPARARSPKQVAPVLDDSRFTPPKAKNMPPKRGVKKPKAKAPTQTFYYPYMAAPIPISLTEEDISIDMHIMQSLLVAQQEAVKRASVEREVAAQEQAQAAAAAAAHAASYAAARPAAFLAQPPRMDYQTTAAAYAAAVQAAQSGAQQQQQQAQAQPAKAPGLSSPCTMQQLQQLPQMQPAGYALA
ncbi:hypothetical protein COHA_010049 [Chlorella ohadii]|uniref:Uncharacterized protein n=1 Tax=Chlorella ohadii TaxID=2649997 RepID=A0AAD5DDK4_9CHLO|nr:hypothetical protein COHA_010049 [Chlorella ohadii]